MSKERELLNRSRYNLDREYCADLIDEIQELLAQPEQEQEPVAWMQDSIELYVLEEKSAIRGYVIPLYTAPPKREPLSGGEVLKIAIKIAGDSWNKYDPTDFGGTGIFELARAIEKHHGIGVDYE